ncbi:MAG: hypothetical protein AAF658_20820, partial [Myxococcota bacterium]
DEFYDPDGNAGDIGTFRDTLFSIYAEYGVIEDLTLLGNLPFRRLTVNRREGRLSGVEIFEGDAVNAISDAQIGALYRLWSGGGSVLSLYGQLGLPIGVTGQENGLVTGDGEADVTGQLRVGHGFSGLPIYVSLEAGYTARFEGFSDEIPYRAEVGWVFNDWGGLLLARANGIQSLKNGEDGTGETVANEANLFVNNASFLALQAEFTVSVFDGLGVSAAAETAVYGENVFRASAFTVGLVWER